MPLASRKHINLEQYHLKFVSVEAIFSKESITDAKDLEDNVLKIANHDKKEIEVQEDFIGWTT